MHTPITLNPVSILSNPAPVPKLGNGGPSDDQFHQVLSREVDERRNSNSSNHVDQASNNPTSNKVAAKQTDRSGSPQPAPAGKTAAKSADGKTSSKAADGVDQASEKKADKDTGGDAVSAVPQDATAALLALVANLNQPAPRAAGPEAKAADADGTVAELDDATASARQGKGARSETVDANADETDLRGKAAAVDSADQKKNPASAADLVERSAEQAQQTFQSIAAAAKKQEALPSASTAAIAAAQAAPVNLAQLAPAHPTEKLTPPVGSSAWDQALGQKIVWMVGGLQQTASLTLNPPDLGPLQVVLHVTNEQTNATFIAAQPEVRQAIEAALPKLREMMSDAGIQLGQTSVNAGSGNQGGSQAGTSGEQPRQAQSSRLQDGTTDTDLRTARPRTITSSLGVVDTFV